MTHTLESAATQELPSGVEAVDAGGGRDIPSDAAAAGNVIAFPPRLMAPCRVRLAGEILVMPALPCWPEEDRGDD